MSGASRPIRRRIERDSGEPLPRHLHHFFREVERPRRGSSWEEEGWRHPSQVQSAQCPEEAQSPGEHRARRRV
jgi:hypothetical protein